MINFNGHILLYSKPTDMRKSIDGLSIIISKELDLNPVRICADGSSVLALDARANLESSDSHV